MRTIIHRLARVAHIKGSRLQDNALDAIARGQMTPADLNALDLSHWLLDLAAWLERLEAPRRKVKPENERMNA